MNCGVALYNTDAWTTWRTAFRECVKLATQSDSVSQERLQVWLTVGNGECGEWSIRGAENAVAWVVSVGGNMDELLKSYDWAWLRERFTTLYPT